jgi:hypothetical protein
MVMLTEKEGGIEDLILLNLTGAMSAVIVSGRNG